MKNSNIVSLKELREQFPEYIAQVAKGKSYTVIKRSKAIFQISPVHDDGNWETISDFTSIDTKGVSADVLLKNL